MGEPEERGGGETEGRSRIPAGSVFYTRVVPAVLIGLGILTAVLIVLAAGIALGIVPYQ